MKIRKCAFYVHFKCQNSQVQGTPKRKEGGFQDQFKSHRAIHLISVPHPHVEELPFFSSLTIK